MAKIISIFLHTLKKKKKTRCLIMDVIIYEIIVVFFKVCFGSSLIYIFN